MVDHLGPRTVPDLLAERIAADGDKVALVFEDTAGARRQFTYHQLGDRVARVAGGLRELGVGRDDKVVLHLANGPEIVFAFLALASLGAVGVPSNTANRRNELLHLVGWSDAKLVITSTAFVGLFESVLADTPAVERLIVAGDAPAPHLPFATLLGAAPLAQPVRVDAEAPLEIIFTSGTTALPKGVVLTHANWRWAGERASHGLRLDDRDRLLTALPLFHVNAQSFTLLSALTVGATAIFLESYSASRFMSQVREHGATHTSLVAMLVRTLLARRREVADREHALRRVTYAINVSTAEKEAFEERFGIELLNGYGLSEAMTEVTLCPVYGARRWPSIGPPALGRQVRVVDPDGRDVPTGVVGEIIVHGVPGRTIMKEYYKDPEATAATIVDGWLHTGDNGSFDEAGYLYFFDRGKDMIKRAGENISASEVETVLADHPDVAVAAVIGVPDPIRDEAVMAFVVARPGATLTAEDVVAHCEQRLAPFKVPTIVDVCDELPMTAIGKVEKKLLRRRAAEAAPR